jgi:protein-tyrosine phosphatase
MAQVVLASRLAQAGLGDQVEVVSAGTGDWHMGQPIDRRAAAVLTAHGYDASQHRAQQFDTAWFEDCDLILAMDAANRSDIAALLPEGADASRIRMFREFDPRATDDDRDVPDPFYGEDDGFDAVLAMVERTAATLVSAVEHEVVRG